MIETIIQKTINPRWRFTQSGQVAIYLQNGLQQLPAFFGIHDMDDERIVDFLVYQIYRQRSFIVSGTWQPSYLFSKAAFDKYRSQFIDANGKSGMNYYIDQWLDEGDLSRGQLVSMIANPKPSILKGMVYLASEDTIKKRFLNTEVGLALCQQSTTGWSPLSEVCGRCDNWVECGKLTAEKYPELMRFRREAYGRKKK